METRKDRYRLALKAQRNPKPRGTASLRVPLKSLKGLVVCGQDKSSHLYLSNTVAPG